MLAPGEGVISSDVAVLAPLNHLKVKPVVVPSAVIEMAPLGVSQFVRSVEAVKAITGSAVLSAIVYTKGPAVQLVASFSTNRVYSPAIKLAGALPVKSGDVISGLATFPLNQ